MPDDATATALSAAWALGAISKIETRLGHIYEFLNEHICHAFTPRMTPEQVLLLMRLPPEGCPVGHLTLTGAYNGSNVSYNIKKLAEAEYISYEEGIKPTKIHDQNDRKAPPKKGRFVEGRPHEPDRSPGID